MKKYVEAIKYCELALQYISVEQQPRHYGTLLNNIGDYYSELKSSDPNLRTQKINMSLKYYEMALKIKTKERFPLDYAAIKADIGRVYSNLMGNQIDYYQKSVEFFQEAIQIANENDYPAYFQNFIGNLGSTYLKMYLLDRTKYSEFWEKALLCFKKQIDVSKKLNLQISDAWNKIGETYRNKNTGDHITNLKIAIDAYENAISSLKKFNQSDEEIKLSNSWKNLILAKKEIFLIQKYKIIKGLMVKTKQERVSRGV